MKYIGKITKFIVPAKFSSCLMCTDSSRPSAPSISAPHTAASSTMRRLRADSTGSVGAEQRRDDHEGQRLQHRQQRGRAELAEQQPGARQRRGEQQPHQAHLAVVDHRQRRLHAVEQQHHADQARRDVDVVGDVGVVGLDDRDAEHVAKARREHRQPQQRPHQRRHQAAVLLRELEQLAQTMARSACSACAHAACGAGWLAAHGSSRRLAQLLRRVGAQRVEHVARVQHAFDRRLRDHALAVGEQQRLAQLPVPGAKASVGRPWSRRAASRRAPAPRPRPAPCGAAAAAATSALPAIQAAQSCARHRPLGGLGEAARHLRRAVALELRMPGQRHQPGVADHRPRQHGAVRQGARELAVAVDHPDGVVGAPAVSSSGLARSRSRGSAESLKGLLATTCRP